MIEIGEVQFEVMDTVLLKAKHTFRTFNRSGFDGTGVLFGNWQDEPIQIVCRSVVDDDSEADDLIAKCRSLVKTTTEITDQFEQLWKKVIICNAVVQKERRISTSVNSSKPYEITATFTILLNSDIPDVNVG